MKATPFTIEAGLIAAAAVGVGLWMFKKGSIASAASAVGSGVVNAAGGVASGAVGAVGATVGLPTPSDTTQDPAVARWIIDNAGYFAASKWSGVPALLQALTMPSGSGTPPPPGSTLAANLGVTSPGSDTAAMTSGAAATVAVNNPADAATVAYLIGGNGGGSGSGAVGSDPFLQWTDPTTGMPAGSFSDGAGMGGAAFPSYP